MTPARPSLLLCLTLLTAPPMACQGTPVTGTDADADASDATGASTSATTAATGDDPTTTATPTGPAGACGDGAVDSGEACDDGNALDNDMCTSKCQVPSCTDGARTGNETDIDCGGDCGPCPDDAVCFGNADCESGLCSGKCVGLYPSCYQLHLYFPSLQDGDYGLDPDGDGTPTTFHCLMLDGGWTEVGRDDFTAPTGWSAGMPGSCGTLSDHLLGGAGQFGAGAVTERTFPLQGVAHMEVGVVADVIIIDWW
jgi:cysteine-rich repeat protein